MPNTTEPTAGDGRAPASGHVAASHAPTRTTECLNRLEGLRALLERMS